MNKLTALLILLLMSGCTEIGIVEKDIPFEGKYVINGVLVGGSNTTVVSVSSSFPLQEDLGKNEAAVKDITAYIWSEKQGIYPLIHKGNGNYSPADDLTINYGDEYQLNIKAGTDRIFGSTKVPDLPEIIEVQISEDHLLVKLLGKRDAVYGCKYSAGGSLNNNDFSEEIFYEISEPVLLENELIEIRTESIPPDVFNYPENYTLNLEIYAFDYRYREYYYSRLNSKPVENIFSEGGGSVFWNVEGENAIGLFIGMSKFIIRDIEVN
jgi:hypothetical protein